MKPMLLLFLVLAICAPDGTLAPGASPTVEVSLVVLMSLACGVLGGRKLFCYYSSDAQYRQGPGKFFPENIDPSLCTHIIYAFFQADGLGVKAVGWNDLGADGLYARTQKHKQQYPQLRVLLAIGGWVIGSDPFVPIIQSEQTMRTFAQNVTSFLRQNNMDGMDMDWEFPGVRGSTSADKSKFTQLLKTLQQEFTNEAARTGKEKLILTMATPAGSYYIDQGYEPEEVVKHPDYLLLMTYNYHGSWENVTGHPSAVWSHPTLDTGFRLELNMQWTVDYWLSKGARREKLILGIATYGMTFKLENPNNNGPLAPAVIGGGSGARYTRESGIMAYYEVCENLAKYGWTKKWIPEQKVYYAYGPYNNEYQWVGYDDPSTIEIKVNEMINGKNLGGAFVWSVEMDDFTGLCGQGKYPLLNTIVNTMGGLDRGGVAQPQPSPAPQIGNIPVPSLYEQTTFRPPFFATTSAPSPNFATTAPALVNYPSSSCATLGRSGVFRDPDFCGHFFYCVLGPEGGRFFQYTMRCPPGLSFQAQYLTCVYDSNCRNNY